jgi:hypothetical protein
VILGGYAANFLQSGDALAGLIDADGAEAFHAFGNGLGLDDGG